MDKQTFINMIKDGAIKAQNQYGICASLTMAQAILESGWGDSAPGNNLFGIKWTSGCGYASQMLTTKEHINGRWITIKAPFRKYSSMADSVYDHAQFIVNNSRYKNLLGVKDYKIACSLIKQDKYATDPTYTSQLISIIESNNLNRFDNTNTSYSADFIRSVQHDLQKLGFIPTGSENATGIIDFKTKVGIQQFRHVVDLPASNEIDSTLVGALNSIVKMPTIGTGWEANISATKFIQWYVGLPKTGTFDANTVQGIKTWQKKAGIWSVPDGVIREKDWSKIFK